MGIAATPRYMQDNVAGFYDTLSPAAKFYTFFPIWQNDWSMDDRAKDDALKKILPYSDAAKVQTLALISRQDSLMANVSDSLKLSINTKSISPFMTGTGMEHPLENGFAFLQPYGLPYLAGSGVKGVLRHTAMLLAENAFGEGDFGFNAHTIEVLFGTAPEKKDIKPEDCLRGALTFWDVIIQPKESLGKMKMAVDILTPHQSHYLQDGDTPHDSGQPIPVPFLCVGAGAAFNFHITANLHLLGDLHYHWQTMLTKCFEFTTEWFGFGAKTAVGYGVLKLDTAKLEAQQKARDAAQKAKELEADTAHLNENQKLIKAFEANLPEELKWKGKGPTTGILVDVNGTKYGFAELCSVVETWEDEKDITKALNMFELKLPVWFGKPIATNDKWKKRINALKRKVGLI